MAFCNHTEVCSRCYDEIKSRHFFAWPATQA